MTIQTAIDAGDVEGLNRALATFPGSANELIACGPGGKNVTHPLHYVSDKVFEKAISESVELRLVDALLKAGSDVNHKQNETALHAAASLGAEEIGLRLIDAGARPDVLGSLAKRRCIGPRIRDKHVWWHGYWQPERKRTSRIPATVPHRLVGPCMA